MRKISCYIGSVVLAFLARQTGYITVVLDADITEPCI